MKILNYDYRNNPNYNQSMRDYYNRFPNYNMNGPINHQTPQRMSVQRMPNQRIPNQGIPNQRMPNQRMPNQGIPNQGMPGLSDQGPEPFSFNIREATLQNDNFRQAIWTGEHFQITLMSIGVDSDIGDEVHANHDQFIRLEQGEGLVIMGDSMDNMDYQANVRENYAFVIPAGKWHNLVNVGDVPIKLYSIYAPPEHPQGTVHQTKEEAMEDE